MLRIISWLFVRSRRHEVLSVNTRAFWVRRDAITTGWKEN